jgi:ABC-type multidrug transport system ATPase subunit/ABC-type multidrug transport system permease subunit
MGASGAGKTSLLNILSGRATTGGSIKIDADVRLNNYAVDPTNLQVRKLIAFVAQDDSLQATTTPREAIRFSAKLRGPRCTTEAQLDKLATRMIDELGLSSCADSIVGGPLLKGISGGERKRASVGVELVTRPAMVFLDEPTSGLDSFSAVQVCQVLKKVANAGASVLFTIHQPSSEIFTSFDHLILLHKGRVLYQGSTTNVSNYFGARGYPCPNNFNPADWIVNVAQKYSPALLEKQGFFPEDDREMTEPNIPGHGQDALGNTIHRTSSVLAKGNEQQTPGFWTQVKMLSRRELVHMYRFPLVPKARFGLTTGLSFLVGTIFWEVGEASVADPFYLQSRFGAIMILLVFAMIGSAQPAILFFPEERPIFLREYTTDHYSVPAYFLSRLFIELFNTLIQIFIMVTIIWNMVKFQGSYLMYYLVTVALAITATALAVLLGVISRGNAKVAQQLLPLIMLPQLLFSGFFVSPDLIPVWLQWPQYLCVLTYTVRLLMLEEFYECSDEPLEARSCDLVLENVQADPDEAWWYWLLIAAQFVFFRLMALFLLKRGAKHFY